MGIINKRLTEVSAFINDKEEVIDIGCDHGLLGIYLYLNKKNVRMVSSDINEKPLLKAKENLIKYGLENKIELRCGNGLETLDKDINTIIISGMGGINIVNILSEIKKYPNVSKIVLSPNTDYSFVRRKVTKLGFKLCSEKMVYEKGKYYLISEYQKGKGKADYFFGKLDLTNSIVKNYYANLYHKNILLQEKISLKHLIKRINIKRENLMIKRKMNF